MAAQAPPSRAPVRVRHRSATRRRSGRGVRLSLVDGFELWQRGTSVRVPAAAQRLVALVALRREPLRRALIAEQVWPHLNDPLGSLRVALSRLRRLSPELLAATATHVGLTPRVSVDVWEIEDLASRLIEGDSDVASRESLRLPTAPVLPEWDEGWVEMERERLQQLCLHAIEVHARQLALEGDYAHAIEEVFRILRVDPLRESAVAALLEVHLAEGNDAQATRDFLEFRRRKRAELGVEPSEPIRELMAPLLRGAGSAARDTRPE